MLWEQVFICAQEERFGFTLCSTITARRGEPKLFDKWADNKTVFSGGDFCWQTRGVNVTTQNRCDLSFVKPSLRDLPAPLTPGTCVTAYKPGLLQQDVNKDLIPCIDFHDNLLQPSLRTGLTSQRGREILRAPPCLLRWNETEEVVPGLQYLTLLNYTWLLFASRNLKRNLLPDLSVSTPLELNTFIHMYG